jgi:hypothetical protein
MKRILVLAALVVVLAGGCEATSTLRVVTQVECGGTTYDIEYELEY